MSERSKAANFFLRGVLNSYSQIFFSNSKVFGILLIVVTLINPIVGLSGLLCVALTGVLVFVLGFDKEQFRNGAYGFNSVLTGVLIGYYFKFGPTSLVLIGLTAVTTLMVTVAMSGVASRLGVPFLSLPFLLMGWMVLVASKSIHGLEYNDLNIYTYNNLWALGGSKLVSYYESLSFLKLPPPLELFLRSLGAIFFQYQLLAGILIAVGLIYSSRIAFVLAVVGFVSGYVMFRFLTGGATQIDYTYAGFNFVLTAIALGGIFFVPNVYSFLLAILGSCIGAVMMVALYPVFEHIGLPFYSLSFGLVVILILYAFHFRKHDLHVIRVHHQQQQPERNLYHHRLIQKRYGKSAGFDLYLPFNGKWFISQGHQGDETHKDAWQHAFDFVIVDEHQRTFRLPAASVEDFYCYGLPVLAAAPGVVAEVVDGVDDNEIGKVNMDRNWGNTVVVQHKPDLFSKVSHLKKGTMKVKVGDEVKRGDVLAMNGNSGRSPEPHIHFQMQSMPLVGAATKAFPFAHYLVFNNGMVELKTNEMPKEHETVANIIVTELMRDAFNLIAKKKITMSVRGHRREPYHLTWDVYIDDQNHPYVYCKESGAVAYFQYNGSVFQFNNFYGDTDALLFKF
jgi:urea transporter